MEQIELADIGQIVRQAMALNEAVFDAIQKAPHGIWIALLIVGLAGISQSLGQSVVLFINNIRPWRFILAVGVSVLSYLAGYLLWTTSVWLVGTYAFDLSVSWIAIAAVVGLAYAPQLLAFFELTPYFGNPFGVLLSLWTMLAVLVAVQAGLDLEFWQAVLASSLGWLMIRIWRRTLGRPVYALGFWLERHVIDMRRQYTLNDLPKLRRRGSPPVVRRQKIATYQPAYTPHHDAGEEKV